MASGFKSGSLPHMKYFNEIITLPTLHIFGETDQIIPTEMSEQLSSAFLEPVILRHPGGHYFPATAQQKSVYQSFLKARYLHNSEKDEYE
jgi:fermentation-respiration switch protein FrsA (DUF1100 family)